MIGRSGGRNRRKGRTAGPHSPVVWWSAAVLLTGLASMVGGCSFDSGLDGAECEREGTLSEDGTRRCVDGFWVRTDASPAVDTEEPTKDTKTGETGVDVAPRDTGPGDVSDAIVDTASDTDRDTGMDADAADTLDTFGDADAETGLDTVDTGDTGGFDTSDTADTSRDIDGCSPQTWFFDGDGDSYGVASKTKRQCTKPNNYVAKAGDCDDNDSSDHPNASEDCNGDDDNCDGTIDDGICNKTVNSSCSSDDECISRHCDPGLVPGVMDDCGQAIFVTRTTSDGNLGGLSGADSICQKAARNADLKGSWEAVASDGNHDATNRVSFEPNVANMKGQVVVESERDLWNNQGNVSLKNPVVFDAKRNRHETEVWTGTQADGSSQDYCENNSGWDTGNGGESGTLGKSKKTDKNWIADKQSAKCNTKAAIYCIEVP